METVIAMLWFACACLFFDQDAACNAGPAERAIQLEMTISGKSACL